MEAAGEGNASIVQLLIDRGAEVNTKANGTRTSVYHDMAIVHVFKGWTALFEAVEEEETEVIKILLDNGAKIENTIEKRINNMMEERVTTHRGWTPLMEAIATDDLELIRLLINRGADPRKTTQAGMSVYDLVIERGEGAVVRYFHQLLGK